MRRTHLVALLPLAAAVVLLARPASAPAAPKGYKVIEVKDGGTIRGTCRIKEVVTMPKLSIFKDNDKGCGDKERDTERIIVGADRGLGNCVAYLKSIDAGKEWPESMKSDDRTAVIDQKGCKYRPHVQWMRKETQVAVWNSDGADHNIHSYFETMAESKFNFTSAPGAKNEDSDAAFLKKTGKYLVKCDIHPWMSAFLWVVENPYIEVTSADANDKCKAGEFVLENVPAGTYDVVVWHEGMVETATWDAGKIAAYTYSQDDTKTVSVTVEAGKTVVVPDDKLVFDAPTPPPSK